MNNNDEATAPARNILELRKMRADHLPDAALSEIAWNILLTLFVANADGRRMTGNGAIEIADTQPSTGERWILVLHKEGLLIWDGHGRLEDVVGLTADGVAAVHACMMNAHAFLQVKLPRSAAA